MTLYTLTPVFALGPSLLEKLEALSPVITLGLDLIAPAYHSPIPVPTPWGSTPDPPGLAITAPANPGPALSTTANPVPVASPTALAPPGSAQQLASPQCPGANPQEVPASATGKAADPLLTRATSTSEQIAQAFCLLTYLRFTQQSTVAAPPRSKGYPATALIEEYAANGFPVEVVPGFTLTTIRHAIKKWSHPSMLSLESTAFFQGEILERTHQMFSIVLTEEDATKLFVTAIRIHSLASVDQINHKPRLI